MTRRKASRPTNPIGASKAQYSIQATFDRIVGSCHVVAVGKKTTFDSLDQVRATGAHLQSLPRIPSASQRSSPRAGSSTKTSKPSCLLKPDRATSSGWLRNVMVLNRKKRIDRTSSPNTTAIKSSAFGPCTASGQASGCSTLTSNPSPHANPRTQSRTSVANDRSKFGEWMRRATPLSAHCTAVNEFRADAPPTPINGLRSIERTAPLRAREFAR